jgi:hypothetical protein
MASSPDLTHDAVVETDAYSYNGDVISGSKTREGRGTCIWKGAYSGQKYEGGWKDDKMSGEGVYTYPDGERYEGSWKDSNRSGQGVQTWPNGQRYEGGWKDDQRSGQGVFTWPDDSRDGSRYEGEWRGHLRSGRGVQWLGDGRVFDGAWAGGFPLLGTAMEPDNGGALFRAAFDGRTVFSAANWGKASRVPVGRVAAGGAPPRGGGGGPATVWKARVELQSRAMLEGAFCGLRPHGPATLAEGGVEYAAEYDGARTIAEGPVPVRKQVAQAFHPTDEVASALNFLSNLAGRRALRRRAAPERAARRRPPSPTRRCAVARALTRFGLNLEFLTYLLWAEPPPSSSLPHSPPLPLTQSPIPRTPPSASQDPASRPVTRAGPLAPIDLYTRRRGPRRA